MKITKIYYVKDKCPICKSLYYIEIKTTEFVSNLKNLEIVCDNCHNTFNCQVEQYITEKL